MADNAGTTPDLIADPGAPVPAWRLFLEFLRLGVTAFGGPAMVAYIRDLSVRKRRWLSVEAFDDGTALVQSIPGATAMQMVGYVGLRAGGPWGALAAFVAFGLPAFLIMLAMSMAYLEWHTVDQVAAAFQGIKVIVVAIVASAAWSFGRSTIRNWRDAVLAAAAAAFLIADGSPILVVAASAVISLLLYRGLAIPTRAGGAALGSARRLLRFAVATALVAAAGFAALFLIDRELFSLGALMLKVDLFAFGGGLASLPLMMHEVVDVREWMSRAVFMDGTALGQITPGPMVITATFVGYFRASLPGAAAATVGIFTPSFLALLVSVPYFDRLGKSLLFRRAVRGVLASFVGLLVATMVKFAWAAPWGVGYVVLAVVAFTALRLKVDILWVVLAAAALSLLIH